MIRSENCLRKRIKPHRESPGLEKMIPSILLILPLLAAVMFHAGQADGFQQQEAPPQLVLRLVQTVREMKKADPDENILLSPEDVKKNKALAADLNRLLHVRYISKYALMKHWNTITDQHRELFVSVFTDLLSKVAYPNAGKFLKDLEFSIRREKKIRNKVMVYTTVIHKEEGRIDIDFKLMQSNGGWVVIDVYLDGVSLARNLRTQCLKIIREDSFEALIARMTQKIEERDTAHLKEVTGRE